MPTLAELNVVIGADIDAFDKQVKTLEKGIGQLGSRLKASGEALTTYVTLPLALLAGASLKAVGDLQALEKGFAATYKGAGNVNDELRKTQEVAKLPGLGLKEAIQGATNLQAVGFAADQSRKILEGYGNALATVGKGKADLEGVITALSQMSAKGKISAEEINQIAERVPQIRKVMQDAFGTADTEVLQKMGISVDQFVAKTTAELNKLPKVTGGINNAFENMADSGFLALSKLGNGLNKAFNVEGKLNALGDALSGLAEDFDSLSPFAQKTIFVLGGIVAAAGPVFLGLGAIAAITPSVVAGFGLLTTGATALKVALLGTAGTVAIVVAAVAAVAVVGYKIAKSMEVSSAQAEQANKAYKDQKTAFDNLQTSISPLLARYEELKAKTTLTKEEQAEMGEIIKKITGVLPNAASQFDKYGNALDINAGKVRVMVAEQKRLADSMRSTALQEQAKQLHINAGAIQEVNNLLKTGGRYKFDNRGGQTFEPLSNEEKKANAERLAFLKKQRDEYVNTYREIKGLPPLVAPTPPPVNTAPQEKIIALLKVQNDLLDIQKGKIANATDEKSLAAANARAAAIKLEIDRLENLGIANSKMADTLKDLNQDLYLNGQYSKALGDSYAFVDERRGILESGLKKLIDAGFSPGSSAVRKFKAELDSLPTSIDTLKPSFENTIPSWAGYLKNFAETGRFVVNDLKAGFEALTGSVQKVPLIEPPQLNLEGWDAFKNELATQFGSITELVETGLGMAFNGLTDTISNTFIGLADGMSSGIAAFKNGLKDLAKSFGQFMIKWGAAQLLLNPFLGAAAIVAGGALLALSGGGGASAPTRGGTGSAPSYQTPTSRSTFQGPANAQSQEITWTIKGTDLVGVLRKQAYVAGR